MSEEFRPSPNSSTKDGTPCLAKVVSVVDQTYNGVLEVQLMREVGSDEAASAQIRTVKYLSPFYGVTSYDYLGQDPDTHDQTQKSYGFWMVPPDVGSYVVCIFLNGDEKKGYWIGCPLMNENMNFSTPGFAATEYIVEDSRETNIEKSRVPGTEYNKKIHEGNEDGTKKPKPEHPLAKFLEDQGLLKDDIRGITSSSARREVPSMVFGISTPGPIDKNGKTGKVGKAESKINNAFVSRLGGSSFVMDDGDDKWERETLPTEGPPIYKNVEENETGLRDRPHNELLRLRTRTGHQILLHNSEDLIYIGNSRGTAWIELTSDGKIDIFSEDSVNVRTKQDFNFYADRDFNLEAGRNFNLKVNGEMHSHILQDNILIVDQNQTIQVKQNVNVTYNGNYLQNVEGNFDKNIGGISKFTTGATLNLYSGGSNNFTAGGTTNIKSGGQHIETASQIHMNGPSAATADQADQSELPKPLTTHSLPDLSAQDSWESLSNLNTILRRIPTYEPYPHHENLDPQLFKPDRLDRDSEERYEGVTQSLSEPGQGWRNYSTSIDTFQRNPPVEENTDDEGSWGQ